MMRMGRQRELPTSFVHGPLTSSGFTTFAHLCWHCTSLRSGNWPAIMSHRKLVPCCSALLTSCFNKASCKRKSDLCRKAKIFRSTLPTAFYLRDLNARNEEGRTHGRSIDPRRLSHVKSCKCTLCSMGQPRHLPPDTAAQLAAENTRGGHFFGEGGIRMFIVFLPVLLSLNLLHGNDTM